MSDLERKALEILVKYAELVNTQFATLLRRMNIAEATLNTNTELSAAYKKAAENAPVAPLGGMAEELIKLRKAVEQLQNGKVKK